MLYKYKTELSKKKYVPLPQKETNQMVMDYHSTADEKLLARIVETHMRMVLKCIEKNFVYTNEYEYMEWISIGNESLLKSIGEYKVIGVDFSYYAYVSIRNEILSSMKKNVMIKGERINGVFYKARIDYKVDEELVDEPSTKEVDNLELLGLIDSLDIKKKSKEIFIETFGLIDGVPKNSTTTSELFKCSKQNIRISVTRTLWIIKENKLFLKKIKDLMVF